MKNSVLQKAGRFPFYPLVFATFPILSLFVQNMGKGYLPEALLITAGAFIFCVLLCLLVNLLVRNWDRSAIIVSAFFLLFFSYGHVRSAVAGILALLNLQDKALVLLHSSSARAVWLVLWGLLFAVACYLTLRVLRKPSVATQALNIMSLTLLVILAANAFSAGGIPGLLKSHVAELTQPAPDSATASSPGDLKAASFSVFLPLVASTRQQTGNIEARDNYSDLYRGLWLEDIKAGSHAPDPKPDIYYIVLDKYVRSDYLQEVFGFDNSEFISALESRGFFVAGKSNTNYAYTINSLASSLNFMHLDELITQEGELSDFDYSRSHWFLAAMIRDSRTTTFLRSLGYTTMAFDTGFWWTDLKDADIYLEPPFAGLSVSEFQLGLLDLTPLSAVPALQGSRDDASRQRVLYPLEHIPDATVDDAPTFVFAHIISPHPPYVFKADGKPVQHQDHYTFDEYVEAYTDQVAHINKRVVELVDEILAESASPPIIIIQADHGTCYGTPTEFGPCMGERMSILNAYYFPDQEYRDLYADITPVNTFRIVFNRFFGTKYVLLDDRSYYSRPESYFILTDVTDRVSGDE